MKSYEEKFETYLKRRISSARSGAIRRRLKFDITSKDVEELLELQDYCCYYSGIRFVDTRGMGYFGAQNKYGFSIDRKDASKGYTRDNIVFCLNIINTSKGKLSAEEYIRRTRDEATTAWRAVGRPDPTEGEIWGFLANSNDYMRDVARDTLRKEKYHPFQ